ncbi:hypothetical protein Y032_0010g931 [Ancylostoma ceylanicum]|uniref:Uncharacterized protein n=1 Tax=Ancylostoma ceylanicum TaxID=53326 RepID=A0A016VIX8_9BILA|nr:hypothetical protein Y032_0010g931 [Ancylostoma ceylanicum]
MSTTCRTLPNEGQVSSRDQRHPIYKTLCLNAQPFCFFKLFRIAIHSNSITIYHFQEALWRSLQVLSGEAALRSPHFPTIAVHYRAPFEICAPRLLFLESFTFLGSVCVFSCCLWLPTMFTCILHHSKTTAT